MQTGGRRVRGENPTMLWRRKSKKRASDREQADGKTSVSRSFQTDPATESPALQGGAAPQSDTGRQYGQAHPLPGYSGDAASQEMLPDGAAPEILIPPYLRKAGQGGRRRHPVTETNTADDTSGSSFQDDGNVPPAIDLDSMIGEAREAALATRTQYSTDAALAVIEKAAELWRDTEYGPRLGTIEWLAEEHAMDPRLVTAGLDAMFTAPDSARLEALVRASEANRPGTRKTSATTAGRRMGAPRPGGPVILCHLAERCPGEALGPVLASIIARIPLVLHEPARPPALADRTSVV